MIADDESIVIEQPQSFSKEIVHELSATPSNGHPKLSILESHDTLIVKQQTDIMGSMCECCGCCDIINKYGIKDKSGKTIMTAVEEDPWCCDCNCCRKGRKFEMKIIDDDGEEIIHLHKPRDCNCCRCCCCCQFLELEVQSPPGKRIGTVKEVWSCFAPQFKAYDRNHQIFDINGSLCDASCCCCCRNNDFTLYNHESGKKCGVISKKWSGLIREVFTSSDNFGINFPLDTSPKHKAILLGACILIDLLLYEEEKEKIEK